MFLHTASNPRLELEAGQSRGGTEPGRDRAGAGQSRGGTEPGRDRAGAGQSRGGTEPRRDRAGAGQSRGGTEPGAGNAKRLTDFHCYIINSYR